VFAGFPPPYHSNFLDCSEVAFEGAEAPNVRNLKSAKALGIAVPRLIFTVADEVID
jgi:hypothetical protein